MSIKAGKSGSVKVSTNAVAEIGEWTLTFGFNLVDSASFGDSWEEKTATIGKWSGSFKGNFDISDTATAALQSAALNGTTVSLKLYEDGSKYYSGTAYIEMTNSATVTGLVEASYNFTGTSTLSYT